MDNLLIFLGVLLIFSEQAIGASPPSCLDITQDLLPCLSYINRDDPKPSDDCCTGMQRLSPSVRSKNDRVVVCQCLVNQAPSSGVVDFSLIPSLPSKCGLQVQLPPISGNMNCSMV